MILVDTSIWIDHLRHEQSDLAARLHGDRVGTHPLVIEELALGSISDSTEFLTLLERLWQFPVLNHREFLALVNRQNLWSRGLGAVDVHLLGSAAMVPGARLWTRDKRLAQAGYEIGISEIHDG